MALLDYIHKETLSLRKKRTFQVGHLVSAWQTQLGTAYFIRRCCDIRCLACGLQSLPARFRAKLFSAALRQAHRGLFYHLQNVGKGNTHLTHQHADLSGSTHKTNVPLLLHVHPRLAGPVQLTGRVPAAQKGKVKVNPISVLQEAAQPPLLMFCMADKPMVSHSVSMSAVMAIALAPIKSEDQCSVSTV